MKLNNQNYAYNRRRFLEHFAALGLASVLPAAGMAQATPESPGKITAETIDEAAHLSVVELAVLIEAQQVSSMELTRVYLGRPKRYDPNIRFVINLTEELALRQAGRADEEIASGKYRGPLHGIPYGIKDLFAVKGYPTTWGAEPFKDRIFDRDATVAGCDGLSPPASGNSRI